MNITQNVIHDLLPAYIAGEASADTVALVEEFLRSDPGLAQTVESLRAANPLPVLPASLAPTREKETLNMTKQLLRWRGILMGLALFLTLVPLSFRFDGGHVKWTFLHDSPPLALTFVCLAALACWIGFLYLRRRLRSAGI
jgi:anti-sigma factor RsiW